GQNMVLAGEAAQCKEALLERFEFARVELELARRGLQRRQRIGGFGGSALGRGERYIEKSLSALAGPLQASCRARQRGLCAGRAAELTDRVGQGFGQP